MVHALYQSFKRLVGRASLRVLPSNICAGEFHIPICTIFHIPICTAAKPLPPILCQSYPLSLCCCKATSWQSSRQPLPSCLTVHNGLLVSFWIWTIRRKLRLPRLRDVQRKPNRKTNEIKRNIIPMKIRMMKMTIWKRLVIIKSSRTHSNQQHNDDQIAHQNHGTDDLRSEENKNDIDRRHANSFGTSSPSGVLC